MIVKNYCGSEMNRALGSIICLKTLTPKDARICRLRQEVTQLLDLSHFRAYLFGYMSNTQNLTVETLKRAVEIQEEIEALQSQVKQLLGGEIPVPFSPKGKRTMSASARARIGAAQKARWAKVKGTASPGRKPRRKMSPAAKARLSAIAKARWKKAKASGKATL